MGDNKPYTGMFLFLIEGNGFRLLLGLIKALQLSARNHVSSVTLR